MNTIIWATLIALAFGLASPPAPEPDHDRELIAAAARGDLVALQRALDAGADVDAALDAEGPMPTSALGAAIAAGSGASVLALLERGANPRAHEASAVQLAIMLEDVQATEQLLRALGPIREEDPPFVNMLVTRPSADGATLFRQMVLAEATGAGLDSKPSLEDMLIAMFSGRFALEADDDALRILDMLVRAGAPLEIETPSLPDDTEFTPLLLAASAGDLLMMEALRVRGAELPDGWNEAMLSQLALGGAARSGNAPAIPMLLARGADPNRPAIGSGYALPAATELKRAEMVQVLLASGARPDLFGPEQTSPLHTAAAADRTDIVRMLLENGASPGLIDDKRGWPLRAATRAGASESVRMLVAAGAEVNEVDRLGRTVLHDFTEPGAAVSMPGVEQSIGHYRTVRVLGELRFDFTRTDQNGRSALGSLVSRAPNDLTLLNVFAEAGSPATADFMAAAVESNRSDLVEWGLRHGASPNQPRGLLESAFDQLRSGYARPAESAAALLRAGAQLPADPLETARLVQEAAASGADGVLVELVRLGASPDGRTQNATALDEALRNGHAAAVRFLREKSASLTAPQAEDGTVAHVLMSRALLPGFGPQSVGPGQQRGLAALIDSGLDIGSRDSRGRTIEAIAASSPEVLERWRGAIALAGSGETELHRAVRSNDLAAIARLLDVGAQANATDHFGRSPLTLALQLGHKRVAEHLLRNGAAYTKQRVNAYQVADLEFASDPQLAAAFLIRMFSEPGPVLSLAANRARTHPDTSLARFAANQAQGVEDVIWTVGCTQCINGPLRVSGSERGNLWVKSLRWDEPGRTGFAIVQHNLGPSTIRLVDVLPGTTTHGETVIELEWEVGGTLRIPSCGFDFFTDPTCYPAVEITNPNLTSNDLQFRTASGWVSFPSATMTLVQNNSSRTLLPGETVVLDRSRGPINIAIGPVKSKVFTLRLTVGLGAGPALVASPNFEDDHARAATYARIVSMRDEARRLADVSGPSVPVRAKTLATAVHVTSAMAVKAGYPNLLRDRLRRRAEEIRRLDLQSAAVLLAVSGRSSMPPSELALLIVRINQLLADRTLPGREALVQVRNGLERAREAAGATASAIELIRENLFSDFDYVVRDYQALILEYAQYVPPGELREVISDESRSAVAQRVGPADVVIADAMVNGKGAEARRAFGLPVPAEAQP